MLISKGNEEMSISEKDLEVIGQYVQGHLPEWLRNTGHPAIGENTHLFALMQKMDDRIADNTERIIRVEEELKNQRELMKQGFDLMEKRFEQVDKRFEQVDKRFEQVDKRFEQVDKRFEQVEKRFEQVDRRFEQSDRRFESLENRMFKFMIWSFGLTISCTGIIIAVMKLT